MLVVGGLHLQKKKRGLGGTMFRMVAVYFSVYFSSSLLSPSHFLLYFSFFPFPFRTTGSNSWGKDGFFPRHERASGGLMIVGLGWQLLKKPFGGDRPEGDGVTIIEHLTRANGFLGARSQTDHSSYRFSS